jgi:hypothetical protein
MAVAMNASLARVLSTASTDSIGYRLEVPAEWVAHPDAPSVTTTAPSTRRPARGQEATCGSWPSARSARASISLGTSTSTCSQGIDVASAGWASSGAGWTNTRAPLLLAGLSRPFLSHGPATAPGQDARQTRAAPLHTGGQPLDRASGRAPHPSLRQPRAIREDINSRRQGERSKPGAVDALRLVRRRRVSVQPAEASRLHQPGEAELLRGVADGLDGSAHCRRYACHHWCAVGLPGPRLVGDQSAGEGTCAVGFHQAAEL